ncbi:hypothetical protein V8C42DRAFT_337375 [Trichoderma barbatum]
MRLLERLYSLWGIMLVVMAPVLRSFKESYSSWVLSFMGRSAVFVVGTILISLLKSSYLRVLSKHWKLPLVLQRKRQNSRL